MSSRKKLTTWLGVLVWLPGQTVNVIRVTVFETAMGSMIGAAIVARAGDRDPSLVTLIVGLGIPLSFLTFARQVVAAGTPGLKASRLSA